MSVLVVTGTGTGIGKTVVSAAVCTLAVARGSSVAYVKVAQTGLEAGEPSDADEVRRLAGPVETLEGARYDAPLSPAAAARLAGRPAVDLHAVEVVVRTLATELALVVVEGAGGLLVRYDEQAATLADLARALDAPLLVVTRPGLGALNETALTLEAAAARGLRLDGLVLGSWPAEPGLAERSNIADLEALVGRPLAGALPEGASAAPAFGGLAARSLAPRHGGSFAAGDFRARWRLPPLPPAQEET